MVTIGSLFSGLGGLELGLEWSGIGPVIFQCEIDPFCREVLRKHWPQAEIFDDIKISRWWPKVDLLCGGFPCQDLSRAGKRAGLDGKQSGLWFYFAKVIQAIHPRFVVVENVASSLERWLPTVRQNLHVLGYDSTAYTLSAEDVGAPHLRKRLFLIAQCQDRRGEARTHGSKAFTRWDQTKTRYRPVVDPVCARRQWHECTKEGLTKSGWWDAEPPVDRVADGVSNQLDKSRIKALGNAVVPQCAQVIGKIIREMFENGITSVHARGRASVSSRGLHTGTP